MPQQNTWSPLSSAPRRLLPFEFFIYPVNEYAQILLNPPFDGLIAFLFSVQPNAFSKIGRWAAQVPEKLQNPLNNSTSGASILLSDSSIFSLGTGLPATAFYATVNLEYFTTYNNANSI
jgi:hypothetical protein